MKIEIISIGNEVLRGRTLNTNTKYLSSEIAKLGLRVYRHVVIQDDPLAIEKSIYDALLNNDITIFTGGLGPTIDDITKQCIAKVFKAPLTFDKTLADELAKKWGKDLPSLENQATVPKGLTLLKNTLGTAPGFLYDSDKLIAFLPGVPYEMKAMFQNELLDFILKKRINEAPFYSKELHFANLVEVYVDPFLRELKEKYPQVNFGIYPSLGRLSVCIEAKDKSLLQEPSRVLKEAFKNHFYESQSGRLEEAILDKFKHNNISLGLAESCTGGAIAAALTCIAGASIYFKGSIVSYSNEAKIQVLKVKKETIENYGAVSKETVLEMAQGALDVLNTDVALSVSGIAGPDGGSLEKPVGTVWACIAFKNGSKFAWSFLAQGTRELIIEHTIYETLGVLNSKL